VVIATCPNEVTGFACHFGLGLFTPAADA